MADVLQRIVATKQTEVAAGKQQHSINDLTELMAAQSPCRGFHLAKNSNFQILDMPIFQKNEFSSKTKFLGR